MATSKKSAVKKKAAAPVKNRVTLKKAEKVSLPSEPLAINFDPGNIKAIQELTGALNNHSQTMRMFIEKAASISVAAPAPAAVTPTPVAAPAAVSTPVKTEGKITKTELRQVIQQKVAEKKQSGLLGVLKQFGVGNATDLADDHVEEAYNLIKAL